VTGSTLDWAIALHGGAGLITSEAMRPEQEQAYRAALGDALAVATGMLASCGTALDVVEATVRWLEACPLFNAGFGSAYTLAGTIEMDAAIMEGGTRRAGAVAGVGGILHPISAARAVLDGTPHVLLAGIGAESFLAATGLSGSATPGALYTETRWQAFVDYAQQHGLAAAQAPKPPFADDDRTVHVFEEGKYGTVGVVVRDREGKLAAGTSTGGVLGQRWGRVGDSPIIGAGTYASPCCAVSATGTGEHFLRTSATRMVAARIELQHASLDQALTDTLAEVSEIGGHGGMIAVDAAGKLACRFTTPGMFRASADSTGHHEVALYDHRRRGRSPPIEEAGIRFSK
jgi:beta-aspartyl-peptidase (threonine type)